MTHTIMIIDDDADIRTILDTFLQQEGFKTCVFESGRTAFKAFTQVISLIILDVSMPDMNGYEFCTRIREISDVPILFLTARTQTSDLIQGFNVGGDDYLTKPFIRDELIARVKAHIRRHATIITPHFIANNTLLLPQSLIIHLDSHRVTKDAFSVSLSDKEFSILLLLATHRSHVFSIPEIYELVWGEPYLHESANTVMVHIRKLREKIENDPKNARIIRNIWGKGYTIDA